MHSRLITTITLLFILVITLSVISPACKKDSKDIITIYGCMDPTSLNYNPKANRDNGICYYAPSLSISPNPADSFINISYTLDTCTHVTIQLYDITGGSIYSQLLKVKPGKNIQNINVSTLSNGLYILRLDNKCSNLDAKVLIQR